MRKRIQSGVAVFFVLAAALLGLGPAYQAGKPLQLAPKSCQYLYGTSATSGFTQVITGEQPATGTFSQQVNIPVSDQQTTRNIQFTLVWASNPGAMSIQIQDADQDVAANYVSVVSPGTSTPITITSAAQAPGSGNYIARVELNPWQGNFARLYVATQPANAVNMTALVCR
jgi:hypothetical protein